MEKEYTFSVLTENQPGLTNRIASILARRKINIYNLTASETETENVYRFVIVVKTTKEVAESVIKQIEKQIDVLEANLYDEEDVLHEEVALYKLSHHELSKSGKIEKLIKQYNAKIIAVEPDYIVIEKAGHKSETQELFEKLKIFGMLDFARSGRVAIKYARTGGVVIKKLFRKIKQKTLINLN